MARNLQRGLEVRALKERHCLRRRLRLEGYALIWEACQLQSLVKSAKKGCSDPHATHQIV